MASPPMPSDPHQLTLFQLRAAQAGDREALNELFSRYRDRVLQVVSLLMGKRRASLLEDEEDIVQDTLLDAFRNLKGYVPPSDGDFLRWLSELALNNLRDALRRGQALKRGEGRVRPMADLSTRYLASSFFPGKEPSPSQVARMRERIEQIEDALIAMPERDRQVFVLRVLCGYSHEEIAKRLGLEAESSARSLWHRVMTRLSKHLPDPNGN